jgi:hypothetical protein
LIVHLVEPGSDVTLCGVDGDDLDTDSTIGFDRTTACAECADLADERAFDRAHP